MFTFELNPEVLFQERASQMHLWGIPASTIKEVRNSVHDMWSDGPGGWVYEWSLKARSAEKAGSWLLAAMLFGAAKFPTLCTGSRKHALHDQVRCYLRASTGFLFHFERHELTIPVQDTTTHVTAHVYSRKKSMDSRLPIVCLSGGVDTCKIELHRLALSIALIGNFRVVTIDMPGTGESEIALRPDGHLIYQGVLQQLNTQNTPTAVIGISFGGYFSAKLGLLGSVDAAVDIGGPVGLEKSSRLLSLPNGMPGIIGNALGLSSLPSEAEANAIQEDFSIAKQGLLHSQSRTPMLIINGDADPYIPLVDTTGFRQFSNAIIWLVPGGYHCAAQQFQRVVAAMLGWLRCRLHGETIINKVLFRSSRLLLPKLL